MARAFDDSKVHGREAGIQDSYVESDQIFLHTADKCLDRLVGAHLKCPYFDFGLRKFGAELGSSVLASLDGSDGHDEVRQVEGEEMAAAVKSQPCTGSSNDRRLARKVDVFG